MIDLDMTLKGLEPNKPPTLKDSIRAHMPAIEEARANGVPWKVILHTLEAAGIVIEPMTAAQARIARSAYRDFGKGSGHPAGLNYGDCFAYALAIDFDEPLLFKGADFDKTDVKIQA